MITTEKIEFSTRFMQDFYATWNSIGSDTETCMMECGERMTHEIAVECIVDADRIEMFGSKESNQEFSRLCEEHGYDKVFKALCEHSMRLV